MKKRNFTQLLCTVAMLLLGIQNTMAAVSNPPATLPSAPTHDASDVFSIFSGAYTNQAVISKFSGPATQTAAKIETVSGDDMIYFETGLNAWSYVHFEETINIDDYEKVHMDVYVVSGAFAFKVLFPSGDIDSPRLGSSVRFYPDLEEGWNSVDMNLADYRALAADKIPDFKKITQIGFINHGGQARTVYIDNIYAYGKKGGSGMKESSIDTSVSVYPNPVVDKVTIHSEAIVNSVCVINFAGQKIKMVQGNEVNMSDIASGVYLLKISLEDGNTVVKKIIKQ